MGKNLLAKTGLVEVLTFEGSSRYILSAPGDTSDRVIYQQCVVFGEQMTRYKESKRNSPNKFLTGNVFFEMVE